MDTKKKQNEQQNILPNLILSFIPVLASYILQTVAFFASFALISMIDNGSGSASQDAPSGAFNVMSYLMSSPLYAGIISLTRFTLFLIIFGFWYHTFFCNPTKKDYQRFREKKISSMCTPLYLILYVILGYAMQLFVSAVLMLCSNIFPKAFTSYQDLIDSMAGSGVSFLTILSVALVAPLAEEIIFRGLTLRYAKKAMPLWLAVIFQALLFAIYHGNIIQGAYAFLFGLFFGFLVIKTDSLVPSVLLHAIINLSAYLVPDILLDSNIKAAVIMAAALIIGICSFLVLSKEFRSQETSFV